MRILYTSLILIGIVAGISLAVTERDLRDQTAATLAVTADAMQVYRNAVVEYAAANPSVTAEVADEDLNLPAWFTRPAGVRNYVDAGDAFVYVVTQTPGATAKLFEDSPKSALVGSAKAGLLFSPVDGFTALSVPSAIPEGAVVYASPKAAAASPCGAPPTVTESQAGTCPPGEYGAFTQTREATWTSAASPICWTQDGWTDWSPSSPPVGACTPCPAPQTETQNVSCPAGEYGSQVQQRSRSFDCSAGSWGSWTAWSTVSSTCAPCPAPESETRNVACPAGSAGVHTQERTRTFDCGAGVWNAWSAWNSVSNTCTPCPAPETETRTVSCAAGEYGSTTQQRSRTYNCTGSGSWNAWSAWTTTSSTCAPCPAPQTETRAVACPSGQFGSVTQTRTRSFDCASGTWGAWSAWTNTSSTCAACPGPETQTQTVNCPAGQFGVIGQERTRSFDCASGTWGAWTSWVNTSNTCTACPSNTTESETRWQNGSANCASGQYGTNTWEFEQVRTRSITYSCPAGTLSAPAPNYGAWSSWSNTGATRNHNNTCTACPGSTTETEQRWDFRNVGCPSGTSGSYTWEMRQSRWRSVSYNCPSGTTSLPAPTYGSWSAWSDDNVTRNTVYTCEANCTVPSPSTETQVQWVPTSGTCPAGQYGSASWEREQSRSRTAYCPAATGAYAWGAWSGWADTGSTRNFSSTCTPCPGQESRWIPYTAANCGNGFYGYQNWQYREVRNASCPAGSTSPTWSAWAWDGNSGVFVNNGTCAACPGASTEAEIQWVARSQACPAGQSGSHTWEAQQSRSRSVSYNCPNGTTSIPPPTYGAWSAWTDTGARRNEVNTCAATYCPVGRTYIGHFIEFYDKDGQREGTCAYFWSDPSNPEWDYIFRRGQFADGQSCDPNDPYWMYENPVGLYCISHDVVGTVFRSCVPRCI